MLPASSIAGMPACDRLLSRKQYVSYLCRSPGKKTSRLPWSLGVMLVGSPVPTSFPYMFPFASKTQPCGSMLPCGWGVGDPCPWGYVEKPGHAVLML